MGRGSFKISNENKSTISMAEKHALVGYYGKTEMNFVKGHFKAFGTGSGSCSGIAAYPGDERLTPVKWNGGATRSGNLTQYDCKDKPQSQHKVRMAAGSQHTTEDNKAQKYEFAADFPYVDLGGSSGFSEHVKLHWSWRSAGYLCGSNAKPSDKPKIFYVN